MFRLFDVLQNFADRTIRESYSSPITFLARCNRQMNGRISCSRTNFEDGIRRFDTRLVNNGGNDSGVLEKVLTERRVGRNQVAAAIVDNCSQQRRNDFCFTVVSADRYTIYSILLSETCNQAGAWAFDGCMAQATEFRLLLGDGKAGKSTVDSNGRNQSSS